MAYYLAVDIGASSGRIIVADTKDKDYVLDEVYRFKNSTIIENSHLVWDIDHIFKEIKEGIKRAIQKYKNIESMAIDSFGCDYVLLNNDERLGKPYSYRDNRTLDLINEVHSIISNEELYKITGSQFQTFNTIYQLYKDKKDGILSKATDFLMIPEYLNYLLTGVKMKEVTMASTTGLLDSSTLAFSKEIISRLNLKKELFKELHKNTEYVGNFKDEIRDEVGGNIKVVLTLSHDTASSVNGIKDFNDSLYISSGTWSLIGVKSNKAIKTKEAFNSNYSNELGENYFRFQKNIMGLWITQRLKDELKIGYLEMAKLARESSFNYIFDVNDRVFLNPKSMKDEIRNYFIKEGLVPPKDDKDLINSVYRSLAYSYKKSIDEIEEITKKSYQDLYIVGGGAQNEFLNEMTKLYTKKNLIIQKTESSSIGNIKGQIGE